MGDSSATGALSAIVSECAREPIHVPGAIQPNGVLMVVDPATGCVVQVSANSLSLFGAAPDALLGHSASDVFGEAKWQAILNSMLPVASKSSGSSLRMLPRYAGIPGTLTVVVSRSPCDRICVELEPAADERAAASLPGGSTPNDICSDGPSPIETGASVGSGSDSGSGTPLEAGNPPAGTSLINRFQALIAAVRGARTTSDLCQIATYKMQHLTGHPRVMIYRFGREGSGQVVAETHAPELEPYMGLHFPASDIPAQARQIYLAQRVRVITDTHYTPSHMLAVEGQSAVDMTFCALRSVSPVHVEYLANMGVRATLTVSLIATDGSLWGLLVCHDPRPHPVTPDLRAVVDVVGQMLSVLLASLSEAEAMAGRLSRERHLRAIGNTLSELTRPLADALRSVEADLLASTAATGAVARIEGRLIRFGVAPSDAVATAVLDILSTAPDLLGSGSGTASTDSLAEQVPAALAEGVAGALVLPLLHGANAAIAWFRPELVAEIKWAGNPEKAPARNLQTGRLSPRTSFAAWKQEVRGRSAPWGDTDFAAAVEIRRMLGDAFIRRMEIDLSALRDQDPLTGLVNRRVLQERLDTLVAQGLDDGHPIALIYIDLDRFKDVNDSLGHSAGDTLLVEVSNRLVTAVGPGHMVARISGDGFAVLCEHVTPAAATALAEVVRRSTERQIMLAGRPYHASASIGVAHSDSLGHVGPALLQAADAAMYAAKREGGNRAAGYTEPLRLEAARRFSLEQDLRAALLSGGVGLSLDFQPIVSVPNGHLIGMEALMRWRHPERGLIPPIEFIPLAEAAGLIVMLGEWVLETGLDAAAQWTLARREAGQALADIPYLTINASPRQLSAGGFTRRATAALAIRDLPSRLLQIEVTEGTIADDAATAELRLLRAAGIKVKIDDFGTGYSSLSYLRRVPADSVKLDRSFLPTASADSRPDAASKTIDEDEFLTILVQLAHTAGLEVVMEGVETATQHLKASRAGADAVQGYLLARPMPLAEITAFIENAAPCWSLVSSAA